MVYDGERIGYRYYRFSGSPYVGDAQPLASTDADVVHDLAEAHHRMVTYRVPDALATGLRLVDELPDNMALLAASVVPPGSASGREVSWQRAELPYGPSLFGPTVRPAQAGRWPTNVRAEADYVDGWGRPGRLLLPVPFVEVVAPTATPTEPALTDAPPTPSSAPHRLYLPQVQRDYLPLPPPTD